MISFEVFMNRSSAGGQGLARSQVLLLGDIILITGYRQTLISHEPLQEFPKNMYRIESFLLFIMRYNLFKLIQY